MSGAVLKEGFLIKSPPLEKTLASWRKRYFRLRESGHLDYYANDKKDVNDKIDGINLGNCTGVESLQHYEGKDFCIKVSTDDRVYVFKCMTEEDLQDWYLLIKTARDSACGIAPVNSEAAGGNLLAIATGSPAVPSRPLPEPVMETGGASSARPLPTLPPAPASAGIMQSVSFDEGMRPKPKRQDTAKPRASLPEVSPLTSHHQSPTPVYPSSKTVRTGSSTGRGSVSVSAAGSRQVPRRDGYTQIDFSAKQPKPAPAPDASAQSQQRINYTQVEIKGQSSDTSPPSQRSIAPPVNRINYTQVDLSAKSRPQANKDQSARNAPSRVSYHQVDLTKTENYRHSSSAASSHVGNSAPLLPAAAHESSGAMQPPPLPGVDEYETMSPTIKDPNLDEYEQMDTPEAPLQPPVQPRLNSAVQPRPSIAPRRSLRSPDRDLPGLPPTHGGGARSGGQPVPPPRPYK